MKFHVLLSALGLIAVIASCAPQTALESQTAQSLPATKSIAASSVTSASGDEQVSTDPATFSLASGSLQLVEFFSYT